MAPEFEKVEEENYKSMKVANNLFIKKYKISFLISSFRARSTKQGLN